MIAIDRDPAKLALASALRRDPCSRGRTHRRCRVRSRTLTRRPRRGLRLRVRGRRSRRCRLCDSKSTRPGGQAVILGKVDVEPARCRLRFGSLMGEKRIIRSSYGGARPRRDFPWLATALSRRQAQARRADLDRACRSSGSTKASTRCGAAASSAPSSMLRLSGDRRCAHPPLAARAGSTARICACRSATCRSRSARRSAIAFVCRTSCTATRRRRLREAAPASWPARRSAARTTGSTS